MVVHYQISERERGIVHRREVAQNHRPDAQEFHEPRHLRHRKIIYRLDDGGVSLQIFFLAVLEESNHRADVGLFVIDLLDNVTRAALTRQIRQQALRTIFFSAANEIVSVLDNRFERGNHVTA